MALIRDNDKFRMYVYTVSKMSIVVNGKKVEDIPNERLLGFNIDERFEEMYFPVFSITLSVSTTLYNTIKKYKNNMKFYLKIDKCYKKSNYPDAVNQSVKSEFINQNFDLIWDEDNDDLTTASSKARNKTNFLNILPDFEQMMEMQQMELKLYLFSSGHLGGLKKSANKVLRNATITDAIGYLATISGIDNILMSPSDYPNKRKEILIPPISCINAFGYLDYKYGIYKKGSMIFFGIKYTYIKPYSGKCTCWDKSGKKNVTLMVPSSTSPNAQRLGMLDRGNTSNNDYIIADFHTLNKNSASISNDYLYGNDLQVIDSFDEEITTELSGATSKGENFVKSYENKSENKDLGKAYTAQTKALSTVIQILTENIDASVLMPNKKYNIMFEDTDFTDKYNGSYMLSAANHTFTRTGNEFLLDTVLILKKTD